MEHDLRETADQIRASVAQICARFPGEYWRKKDREREYPAEFVAALTEAGLLACLIPESYGGSGLPLRMAAEILETIHELGCNAAACHAQMYTMGTLLRHGSEAQKAAYLPRIANGELALQAFGVTEPTAGTDTTAISTTAQRDGDHYVLNGQKVWISRAEHSDLMILLARTTPRDRVEKRSDGLSVFIVDMRHALENGMTIRPIRTMINHSSTEIFFEDVPVYRRCALVHSDGQCVCSRAAGIRSTHRPEPGYSVPDCASPCADRGGGFDGAASRRAVRCRTGLRRRG